MNGVVNQDLAVLVTYLHLLEFASCQANLVIDS
jgi:hypothetical protein